MKLIFGIIIRFGARRQPNIGLTLELALTVFTRSYITPPKVNRFERNLVCVHCLGLSLVDFGRDLRSSDSRRARRNFFFER